ncbi:MAG: class I SAM-dependent methyltransferase family protein [Sulfolobales archaeon]|nr:class I SAM-dependent methyltransferase family protein [Sulfolobales archaeon]
MIRELARKYGTWQRIEILSDVAIIGIPFDRTPEELRSFAEDLLRTLRLRSVWGRYRGVDEVSRVGKYVHLAGERVSEVIYKEHGFKFVLDFTKVFFSQKLMFEHDRLSRLVREGEIVINMFAGFGPLSIMSCKRGNPRVIYSIDISPSAYYYNLVNVDLNKAYCVIPMWRDAFEVINELPEADRIFAPLPELADKAYEVAIRRLKPGGTLHLFAQVEVKKGEDPVKVAMNKYRGAFFARVVRSYKPGVYHVIVDIKAD